MKDQRRTTSSCLKLFHLFCPENYRERVTGRHKNMGKEKSRACWNIRGLAQNTAPIQLAMLQILTTVTGVHSSFEKFYWKNPPVCVQLSCLMTSYCIKWLELLVTFTSNSCTGLVSFVTLHPCMTHESLRAKTAIWGGLVLITMRTQGGYPATDMSRVLRSRHARYWDIATYNFIVW